LRSFQRDPNSTRLDLRNYVKAGDSFSLGLDTAGNALQTVSVKSYLDSKENAVALDVTFAKLRGGLSYPPASRSTSQAADAVMIQNSNYEKVTPAGRRRPRPPRARRRAGGASTAGHRHPDGAHRALPGCPGCPNPAGLDRPRGLQKFAGWMKSNASLKGHCPAGRRGEGRVRVYFVALTPFPEVVKMLVEKPDWTKELGKAFTTNRTAVFDSIQRLRAAAQALGNLKTTPEQKVATETTSSGQQVISSSPPTPR